MTLKEFFDLLADNPQYLLAYFFMIPLTALIANLLGRGEGNLSPWKYLYATLVFLVCIPGIFAITLSIYLFSFERIGIFKTDIYTQVIPILSMVLTLFLVKSNTNLNQLPGFGKLSGLMLMIGAVLVLMWGIDRTRIYVFTYLPFQYVILIFVGLLLIIRMGWSSFFGKSS